MDISPFTLGGLGCAPLFLPRKEWRVVKYSTVHHLSSMIFGCVPACTYTKKLAYSCFLVSYLFAEYKTNCSGKQQSCSTPEVGRFRLCAVTGVESSTAISVKRERG